MRRIAVLVGCLALVTASLAALAFSSGSAPRFLGHTASAQTEETFLSFMSETGDYIGQGQSRTFTLEDAGITATLSEDHRWIQVHVHGSGGSWWYLNLAAPQGQELLPGVYEGATRWPFQSPAEPGLSFYGDGRGCNTLTGRFQVLEADYAPFEYIEGFHATFEQHCEGFPPALFGEVQIINPPPPPPLELAVTIDGKGTVKRASGTATVSGTVTCSQAATVDLAGALAQRASRFVLITGPLSLRLNCTPTPTPWSVTVSGSGGLAFNPGWIQVDVMATALDPNYGSEVMKTAGATVRLAPLR